MGACPPTESWTNRHEPAARGGEKHPGTKDRIAGGGEIEPVQTGRDEAESEDDSNDMPTDHPAPEAVEDVSGQRRKKPFHTQIGVSERGGLVRKGNRCGCRVSGWDVGAGRVRRSPKTVCVTSCPPNLTISSSR